MPQQKERLSSLRKLADAHGLDALVLGMPANVLWLSGFDMVGTFYFTAALVTPEHAPALLVHRAELDMAREESAFDEIAVWGHGQDHVEALGAWLTERVGPLAGRRVGVELDDWLRPRDLAAIADRLGLTWVDVGAEVEELRQRVEGEELARARAAGRIADMTIAVGSSAVASGVGEHEIAAAALRCYALAGGQEQPVPLSVRSGPRLPLARALPSDRRLAAGEAVALEAWATVRRCAAVAATTTVAGAPAEDLLTAWEALEAVLDVVESALRPSATGAGLWEEAAGVAAAAGAQLDEPAGFGLALAFPLRPTTRWRLAPGGGALAAGQVVCVAPRVRAGASAAFAARTYALDDLAATPLTHRPQLWSVGA